MATEINELAANLKKRIESELHESARHRVPQRLKNLKKRIESEPPR